MRVRLAIGDFSRMTHVSVKALRHYHDLGLLEPAEIDQATGYRYYHPDQVWIAQVIRRLRDLGLPLDDIKAILRAPDVADRGEILAGHLRRMESHLAQTQSVVDTLRSLLAGSPTTLEVEHRSVTVIRALAIADHVSALDLHDWWDGAFRELDAALAAAGVGPAGPRAALYSAEYFALESGGEVIAYIPIDGEVAAGGAGPTGTAGGRARIREVPAAELAVAVHRGGFDDLDRTYGALGTYVAEREIGVDGPIREHYLVSPFETDDEARQLTEVGWPIFRT